MLELLSINAGHTRFRSPAPEVKVDVSASFRREPDQAIGGVIRKVSTTRFTATCLQIQRVVNKPYGQITHHMQNL